MASTRKPRPTDKPGYREPLAFPTLIALVAGLVLFGVMHYSVLLAIGSAIFVGFFGWLWWSRQKSAPRATRRKPARAGKKTRRS